MSAQASEGSPNSPQGMPIAEPSRSTPDGRSTQSEGGELSSSTLDEEHPNTDEREKGKWESRYPIDARKEICLDAAYVAFILFLTLAAIIFTWRGATFSIFADGCEKCSRATLDRYAYFYLGGQLGGTLFGVKYLYNVVARGWWNIDRRLWRLLSPFLSAGLALAVGALIDAGIFGITLKTKSGAAYLSLGFIAGYFADSALRKMKEIADTIFGSPEGHNHHSAK